MSGRHHNIYTSVVECYTVVAFSFSNSHLKSIDLEVFVAFVNLCSCWLLFPFQIPF